MQRTTHLRPLIGLGVLALVLCTTVVRDATALPTGVLARWSGDIDARNATGPQFDGTPGLSHKKSFENLNIMKVTSPY